MTTERDFALAFTFQELFDVFAASYAQKSRQYVHGHPMTQQTSRRSAAADREFRENPNICLQQWDDHNSLPLQEDFFTREIRRENFQAVGLQDQFDAVYQAWRYAPANSIDLDRELDEGTEDWVEDLVKSMLIDLKRWIRLYFGNAWVQLSREEREELDRIILRLTITKLATGPGHTAADIIVKLNALSSRYLFHLEIKGTPFASDSAGLLPILEDAVTRGISLSDENYWAGTIGVDMTKHKKVRNTFIQILEQFKKSESKLAVLTMIYGGFYIIRKADDRDTLLVSRNYMAQFSATNDDTRLQTETYKTFLKHLAAFTLMNLHLYEPRLFPPLAGPTPALVTSTTDLASFFYSPRRVKNIARTKQNRFTFWLQWYCWQLAFWLFGPRTICGFICSIRYAPEESPLVLGKRSRFSLPACLQFEEVIKGEFSTVYISPFLGLVLKLYSCDADFQNEKAIYRSLNGHTGIPTLFAWIEPGALSPPGLLLSFEGRPLKEDEFCANELDDLFHQVILPLRRERNIHHHDLANRNIVRGKDGRLRLIDWAQAEYGDSCVSPCPDISALQELGVKFEEADLNTSGYHDRDGCISSEYPPRTTTAIVPFPHCQ